MPRALARLARRSIAQLHRPRGIGDERLYHYQAAHTRSTDEYVSSNAKLLQRRIVEALRLGKRGEASSLLLSLSQGNDLGGDDDFVHVLKYCAVSPDPLFVMEAWSVMNEKKICPSIPCSLLMVKALCKGGYLEEALNLIYYLRESHGVYSILPVYNTFLGACVKMQNLVYTDHCLELMEQERVGKNEETYTQLLKLAVWRENLSVAHKLWKDYIKNYSLSSLSLQKFIRSFSNLGDLKSACKTLQYMVALVIRGNTSVTKSIGGIFYSSRLDIPIPLNCELGLKKVSLEENEQSVPSRYFKNLDGHVVSADQGTRFGLGFGETESVPVNGLSIPDMELLRHSFQDLIYACAKLRNGGLAEQLVQQMQKLGFQINSDVCDGLIRAIVAERGFSSGMEILKCMLQRNLKPHDCTLSTLSIGCSKAFELDLAETLLDQVSIHRQPHPFNTFLAACDITDQPEIALRVLAKMKHLQVRPNIKTYEQLFSLFGNVNAPYEEGNMSSHVDVAKRIKAIEIDMASYGIQHSVLSMTLVLKALGAEGMMKEMIHYLHVAEDYFFRNNMYLGTTAIYNTALNSLVESEDSQMAITIFKSIKSSGFPADAATYNIMIKFCKVLKCYRSACALVSLMLRDGFYPQTVTYTVLIDTLLEEDDSSFDKALDLLDQASLEGMELDIITFNTILKKAGEKERIDVVEFLIGWMQQEKIRPDCMTCSAVFTAYTICGCHSTAMEALQVLSMRMICDKDGSFPEKTKFEDNYIFAEDEGAESRIIKHFTDCEENLAVALLNLRWCSMLGFPISWLPNQSPWEKRLR